jgi:hypothetical protein
MNYSVKIEAPSERGRLYLKQSSFPVLCVCSKDPRTTKYFFVYGLGDLYLQFCDSGLLTCIDSILRYRTGWIISNDLVFPEVYSSGDIYLDKTTGYKNQSNERIKIISNQDYQIACIQVGIKVHCNFISMSENVVIGVHEKKIREVYIRGIENNRTGNNARYFPNYS